MPTPLALQPETPEAALHLAEFLLSFTLLVQLPFAALLLAGTAVALVAGGLGRRGLDRELTEVARGAADLGLPGGRLILLPAAAAVSLAGVQILYGPQLFSWTHWILLLGTLLIGLALIDFFRRRLGRDPGPFHAATLAGVAGLLLCGGSYLLLFFAAALLQRPERWPLVEGQPLLFLSWSGTARFAVLLCLGLLLTSAALSDRSSGKGEEPGDLRGRRRWLWLGLPALLLVAPLLALDLANLPAAAGSLLLFGLYGLMVAAAGWGSVSLAVRTRPAPGRGTAACGLLLILLLVAADHTGRAQILTPQTLHAPEGWLERGAAPPGKEAPGAGGGEAPEAGREVFEEVCSSCHAFDRVLVGPPLNEVLPGYRGDLEGLKEFIRNPVDRSPDYPVMPKLDLSDGEIDAVARYLLRQAGGETGKAGGGHGT